MNTEKTETIKIFEENLGQRNKKMLNLWIYEYSKDIVLYQTSKPTNRSLGICVDYDRDLINIKARDSCFKKIRV